MKVFIVAMVMAIISVLFWYHLDSMAYEPELVVPQYDKSGKFFYVKVIVYSDQQTLNNAYTAYMTERGQDTSNLPLVAGFATWTPETQPLHACVLHVPEPFSTFDQKLAIWGHELAHCVYGQFHK